MTPAADVLVVGSSGFIGGHLVRRLPGLLAGLAGSVPRGISRADLDLSDPAVADRTGACWNWGTDVVWCAAVKRHRNASEDAAATNVRMVRNAVEALRKHPCRRLIYLSSAAVYGESKQLTGITEATPVAPETPYGRSKAESENLLRTELAKRSIPLLILRPSLIDGDGNVHETYRPSGMMDRILAGQPIELWGDGDEKRDWVCVDDVCRAVALLLERRITGTYNLAFGDTRSFREIALIAARVSGRKPAMVQRSRTGARVDQPFDPSAFLRACGSFDHEPVDQWMETLWRHKTT